jgi:hypothetical protein
MLTRLKKTTRLKTTISLTITSLKTTISLIITSLKTIISLDKEVGQVPQIARILSIVTI